MLRATRLTAVRLAVAAALAGILGAFGCTSILGIDGNYTVDTGAGGKRVVRADSGGEGGTGAGGDSVESGGTGESGGGGRSGAGATAGAGGTTVKSDASMPVGTGGTPVDPVGCQRGNYGGTVKGEHAPSFTVVAVPLGLSGPLTFSLAGSGDTLQITNGKMAGTLAGFGPFTLALDGTYNCTSHMMSGHLSGKVNGGITAIDGTLTGDLSATAKDTARPWQESELNPMGQPSTNYKGTGTWNAAYKGP